MVFHIEKEVDRMKIRIYLLVFLSVFAVASHAQTSMKEMWVAMPDSLYPYLNKNMRREMAERYEVKDSTTVQHLLNGRSRMLSLTDSYAKAELNESALIELKSYVTASSDTLLWVVKTYLSPEPESEIYVTSPSWKEMKRMALPYSLHDFFPDTIETSYADELERIVSPVMIGAALSPEADTVSLTLSLPALYGEEKKKAENTLRRLTLTFNELTAAP